MNELLFQELCEKKRVYLSIIERKNNYFSFVAKLLCVFFTKYRSKRLLSERYTLSRYHLIKLANRLLIYKKFNYCFSHTGKYTAILISAESQHISVDIEPVNRHLPKSLKLKIRALYPNLMLQELMIVLILESVVKLSIFGNVVDLSKGLDNLYPVGIIQLESGVYEVSVKNIKVYSRFYIFSGLCVCVTMESVDSDVAL